jgi:hypothetical protein
MYGATAGRRVARVFQGVAGRWNLGKVRGLGRRVASGGAALARTLRQRGRDVAAQNAAWRRLARTRFTEPLFEHTKLQNFE